MKTYSEFSRGGKLTKAITRTDHAAPGILNVDTFGYKGKRTILMMFSYSFFLPLVTSIVWSATEFTDAIRR